VARRGGAAARRPAAHKEAAGTERRERPTRDRYDGRDQREGVGGRGACDWGHRGEARDEGGFDPRTLGLARLG